MSALHLKLLRRLNGGSGSQRRPRAGITAQRTFPAELLMMKWMRLAGALWSACCQDMSGNIEWMHRHEEMMRSLPKTHQAGAFLAFPWSSEPKLLELYYYMKFHIFTLCACKKYSRDIVLFILKYRMATQFIFGHGSRFQYRDAHFRWNGI